MAGILFAWGESLAEYATERGCQISIQTDERKR